MEVKGDLNWTEFVKISDMPCTNEVEAKAMAAAAELNSNLTLYIQRTAQAKLGFEAMYDEEYKYWSILPIIRFEDGSEYMMPEEFFSPNSFPKTVEAVNKALAQMESFLAGPQSESEPLK